jgi:ferredoxin
MTYIIGEACIDVKDISCQSVCPVDCIHEVGRMLVIDAEECIDCGACEPECPVEAILPEDAIPDDWQPFVKINYAFNQELPDKGIGAVNELVEAYCEEHGIVPDAAAEA